MVILDLMAKRPRGPTLMTDDREISVEQKHPRAEVLEEAVSPKTRTLPDAQRGPWLEPPDVVTMLQVFGSATEFELPVDVRRFTLGSAPDCDVSVRDPSISKLHCLIERRGHALRITDQASYNGTFFDGRRETTFDIRPGNTFTVSSVRFLALNSEMHAAYPTLADILGAEDEEDPLGNGTSPDELILIATSGAHVLITGEHGCDQDQLARIIHSISLRRGRELVELEAVPSDRAQQRKIIDRASRSTLVISMDAKHAVMDGAFSASLFSPSYQIRVVAIAPTTSKATSVLGAANMQTIRVVAVRPLSQRPGAIPRLLDRLLIARSSPLRVSDMTRANQAALQAYSWPENFIDLRIAADRLAMIASTPSIRKAAENLQLHPSSLHYWLEHLSLSAPIVGG